MRFILLPACVLGLLPSFFVTFAVAQTIVLVLLIRLIDHYEHEPLSLLGVMALWGAVGATTIALIIDPDVERLLSTNTEIVFGSAIAAPIAEELGKGVALVAAFGFSWWAHLRFGTKRLGGVTDGIVYGAAVGLGFAFTEDIQYFLNAGGNPSELIPRRDFFGLGSLHHALFTAAFGVGLGMIVWTTRRWLRPVWPVAGMLVALMLHAVNNGLVNVVLSLRYGVATVAAYLDPSRAGPLPGRTIAQLDATKLVADRVASFVDYLTFAVAGLLIWYWLSRQRRVIAEELVEEAESGLINARDLDLAPRYWSRLRRSVILIRQGKLERYRVEKALYIQLANLAFLKRQVTRSGRGQPDELQRGREQIRRLKAEERFVKLVGATSRDPF